MINHKKKFLTPEIKVVELEQTEIIAASGDFGEPGPIVPGTW